MMPEPHATATPGFVLRGVSKTYGSGPALVRALDNIDLTVSSGEYVAIMGASGSGKSTCMNILGCLDAPTSGAYLFNGTDVAGRRDERALIRRNLIGFIFQGFNLLGRTSALENVELPLLYRRIAAARRREMARAALSAVGLEGREQHTPAELSGGQQQRVAIARALVSEPALLLADEPTGNLDSERSLEIIDLLVRLNRERGITIVMVTHEAEFAAFAQRIVRFRDGRIASDEQSRKPSHAL